MACSQHLRTAFLDLPVYGYVRWRLCHCQFDPKNQKLRKRKSLALASTFSRIAGSGSIRAISIAPIIVEKIEKNARSLSAVRRPGINGSIRLLYFTSSSTIRRLHRLIGPRQLGRKGRQRAPALGVIAVFRAQVGLHNRLPRRPGLGLLAA